MTSPVLSASQSTRPTLAHFSKPIGVGFPPSTGTITTVEYPGPTPLNIPQAICLPSGDQDGPAVENPFGCLLTAIVRGSPLPSVFATINDMSDWLRRTNANCDPSREKPAGLKTRSRTFAGVPPSTGTR